MENDNQNHALFIQDWPQNYCKFQRIKNKIVFLSKQRQITRSSSFPLLLLRLFVAQSKVKCPDRLMLLLLWIVIYIIVKWKRVKSAFIAQPHTRVTLLHILLLYNSSEYGRHVKVQYSIYIKAKREKGQEGENESRTDRKQFTTFFVQQNQRNINDERFWHFSQFSARMRRKENTSESNGADN